MTGAAIKSNSIIHLLSALNWGPSCWSQLTPPVSLFPTVRSSKGRPPRWSLLKLRSSGSFNDLRRERECVRQGTRHLSLSFIFKVQPDVYNDEKILYIEALYTDGGCCPGVRCEQASALARCLTIRYHAAARICHVLPKDHTYDSLKSMTGVPLG